VFIHHHFIKIYSGPELPHLPWAVSEKVSSDLVLNIQAAMMKLNYSDEGKSLLKKASLSGFEVAIDDDYDGVREIYGKYLKYNETH